MQLPVEGVMLENKGGKFASIRYLNAEDLPAVTALREKAAAGDHAVYISSDTFAEQEALQLGFGVGCFEDEQLIASVFVRVDALDERGIAHSLDFDLSQCVYSADLELLLADGDYFDDRLHLVMIQMAEVGASDRGRSMLMAGIPVSDTELKCDFYRERFELLHTYEEKMILGKRIGALERKRALLVIDYTNDFVADHGKLTAGESAQKIEAEIVRRIEEAYAMQDEIFVMNDLHLPNDRYHPETKLFPPHNITGTSGRDLYGKVANAINRVKAAAPLRIHEFDKTRYSAFVGTPLYTMLRERGIEEVELTGVCTDICVLHTAVDAYELGLHIVVHSGAVASFNPQGHEFALSHFAGSLGATVIETPNGKE